MENNAGNYTGMITVFRNGSVVLNSILSFYSDILYGNV